MSLEKVVAYLTGQDLRAEFQRKRFEVDKGIAVSTHLVFYDVEPTTRMVDFYTHETPSLIGHLIARATGVELLVKGTQRFFHR